MELQTREFGQVTYERHEVVQVEGAWSDSHGETPWLLLADKHHPHLFWLQSISDTSEAVPLCSLAGVPWAATLCISKSQTPSDWESRESLIVLAEIRGENDAFSLDLERLVLIDPQAHRGVRVLTDSDQTLQHALPEKVAPLRECA